MEELEKRLVVDYLFDAYKKAMEEQPEDIKKLLRQQVDFMAEAIKQNGEPPLDLNMEFSLRTMVSWATLKQVTRPQAAQDQLKGGNGNGNKVLLLRTPGGRRG